MELLYQANPADNYVSLHLQSGFVAGAVGGGGRGSEVDYHKMKHRLRRRDSSPRGTRD